MDDTNWCNRVSENSIRNFFSIIKDNARESARDVKSKLHEMNINLIIRNVSNQNDLAEQ